MMITLVSVLNILRANAYKIIIVALLIALAVQSARIDGFLFFDGLKDKVEACEKADDVAETADRIGTGVADANAEQRNARQAEIDAEVKEARENAEQQNPDVAREAADPITNAVADSLRRSQSNGGAR